jgi:cytochrome c556
MRRGLILQKATDPGKPDAIVKGDLPHDAAVATRAVDNIAANASVISMDQRPEGSEFERFADNCAKAAVWANPPDFQLLINGLNTAARAFQRVIAPVQAGIKAGTAGIKAGTAGIKAGTAGIKAGTAGNKAWTAGACLACHKARLQPE